MSDRDSSVDWLLTTQGRIARIVVGSLLIIIGLGIIKGFIGVLLLIIGAIPIASAAYGSFLLGPLFGRDIHGRRPEHQRKDEQPRATEEEDEAEEDDSARDSGSSREQGAEPKETDAPPLARAERPPGQEPRTRDPNASG